MSQSLKLISFLSIQLVFNAVCFAGERSILSSDVSPLTQGKFWPGPTTSICSDGKGTCIASCLGPMSNQQSQSGGALATESQGLKADLTYNVTTETGNLCQQNAVYVPAANLSAYYANCNATLNRMQASIPDNVDRRMNNVNIFGDKGISTASCLSNPFDGVGHSFGGVPTDTAVVGILGAFYTVKKVIQWFGL